MVALRRVLGVMALVALIVTVHAQDEEAEGKGEKELGSGCPFEITVPWTYSKDVTVDMSENVEVDENDPLALSTVCACPSEHKLSLLPSGF